MSNALTDTWGDPSAHAKSQQHHNDATQDELIATEHDRIILFGIFFHHTIFAIIL